MKCPQNTRLNALEMRKGTIKTGFSWSNKNGNGGKDDLMKTSS